MTKISDRECVVACASKALGIFAEVWVTSTDSAGTASSAPRVTGDIWNFIYVIFSRGQKVAASYCQLSDQFIFVPEQRNVR